VKFSVSRNDNSEDGINEDGAATGPGIEVLNLW